MGAGVLALTLAVGKEGKVPAYAGRHRMGALRASQRSHDGRRSRRRSGGGPQRGRRVGHCLAHPLQAALAKAARPPKQGLVEAGGALAALEAAAASAPPTFALANDGGAGRRRRGLRAAWLGRRRKARSERGDERWRGSV